MQLEELPVLFDSSLQIARLLLLHCILDQFLGGLCPEKRTR